MLPNGNFDFTSGFQGTAPNYFGQSIEVLPNGTKTYVQQMTGFEYRSYFMSSLYGPAPPTSSTRVLRTRSWGRGKRLSRYDPPGSTWSFSGKAGVADNATAFTSGNPNAPQGNQVALLQKTGSISQSVNFSLPGTYQISVQRRRAGNNGTSHEKVQVLVDGTVVGHHYPHRHRLRHLHDRIVQRDGRLPHHHLRRHRSHRGRLHARSSIRSTSATP